jgi:hypothetical protein
LNAFIPRSDAINPSKALDDAYRIPMNVVIDKIIAVLQVLTLGNAVRANEQVNLIEFFWEDSGLLLRQWREERQD